MIRAELQRLYRGLVAMREVFGWQFTGVILLVMGLLLWAVFHVHGGIAAVLGLVLVLLAIRAHDLGELPDEEEPTEYSEFWQERDAREAKQRRTRSLEQFQADSDRLFAEKAQVEFLRQRIETALGKSHEPSEL